MGLFSRKAKKTEKKQLMVTATVDFYCLGQIIRQGTKLPADHPLVKNNERNFTVETGDWMNFNDNGQ